MNPLLNSIPPSQAQPYSGSSAQQSTQPLSQPAASTSIIAPSSFQNPIPPPISNNQPMSFALSYPNVTYQPSSNINSSAFLGAPPFTIQSVNIKTTILQPDDSPDPDDLFNFAPVASFRSDLVSPAQFAILNQNPDVASRRNRSSLTFSYRFSSRKQWFDITMVLPYKIVLHEVIIRGPENNYVNAPSAIQIELSSDPAQASWNVLSCPVYSDNPTYYRISTSSYRFPITGVRMHFKCPTSSNMIQLTQIQLLGSTSIRSMRLLGGSKSMFETQLIYHWVSLFSRLCKRIDVSLSLNTWILFSKHCF